MRKTILSFVPAFAAIALVACTAMAEMPAMQADGPGGKILTDAKGMTLYTFAKDSTGKSVCNGKCAENWPPLTAATDAKAEGKYTVVTRDDGSMQWAYGGMPLYGWVKDQKPGDTTGDGVNGTWMIARP